MRACNLARALFCLLLIAIAGCGSKATVIESGPPVDVDPDSIEADDPNYEVVEVTDYKPPAPADDGLEDDQLDAKQTEFDPELIDRRPMGEWRVNQSEAVIKLDVPMALPDQDQALLTLHPSYAAALAAAKQHRSWVTVLPSVNLLDGKAKQFDDGLYAAIDQAYFQGIEGQLESHVELVTRLLAKVDPDSPAAPYLAAALNLAGENVDVKDSAARDKYVAEFDANPAIAKPISFYTWNDTLKRCWAMLRFLQQPRPETDPIMTAIVAALATDEGLAADCRTAAEFYGQLTNPLSRLTPSDLVGVDVSSPAALAELRASQGILYEGVSLYPPSSSRETELFTRLFPEGVPEGANLMRELIRRIRSGEVDLSPRANSGWYDHQVYALETLLLPERGEEHNKLLLTRPYKKRMLEAFAALMTKRRETHARQLEMAPAAAMEMPEKPLTVQPRLRVEPCPSFYVRTARSYAFLNDFLHSAWGEEKLKALKGLRETGEREVDLASELAQMRDRFYGLYLVSCDDIGLAPQLAEGEVADSNACYEAAAAWLEKIAEDQDLAADTRVAVPIYVDPMQRKMRLWTTLGVRLVKLDASYARPPRIKPAAGEAEWQSVEPHRLAMSDYLIAVDEFAEVEVPTLVPPNRQELRRLCDAHRTKEAIVEAISRGKW